MGRFRIAEREHPGRVQGHGKTDLAVPLNVITEGFDAVANQSGLVNASAVGDSFNSGFESEVNPNIDTRLFRLHLAPLSPNGADGQENSWK